MRKILLLGAAIWVASISDASADKASEFFSDYEDYNTQGKALLDKLDPRTGSIDLPDGVNLELRDKFYFVDAAGAKLILTEAWGNPPDSGASAVGMIFPGKLSPLADTWGAQLHPDPIGYVDDKDAASINYSELLDSMKADTLAGNPDRVKAGYEAITLIGWAAPPTYDPVYKRLHWAKELKFGDATNNTLNYDVRFLNRHGVFVVSYIASIDQLPEVNQSLPDLLETVTFDDGMRYADFMPGVDSVAAVGVGGLIAGKAVAKTGILVVLLALLKKFGVFLIVPVAWLWRKLRGS